MSLLAFEPSRFPGIFIDDNSPGFFGPAASALRDLARLKIGYDILDIISKRTRGIGIGGVNPTPDRLKCVVRRGPGTMVDERKENTFAYRAKDPLTPISNDLSNAESVAVDYTHTSRRKRKLVGGHEITIAGTGYSAVATFEPMADYTTFLNGITTPGYVALGHELIHCMHYLSGDTNMFSDDDAWGAGDTYTKHEEARTVGLGIYAKTRISENAIRREAGLPLRTFYSDPGDCDGLTSALRP